MFIVQLLATVILLYYTTVRVEGACPGGWYLDQPNSICYYYYNSTFRTFNNSQIYCKSVYSPSNLPFFNSAAEWIGFRNYTESVPLPATTCTWLGIVSGGNNIWCTITNKLALFTNNLAPTINYGIHAYGVGVTTWHANTLPSTGLTVCQYRPIADPNGATCDAPTTTTKITTAKTTTKITTSTTTLPTTSTTSTTELTTTTTTKLPTSTTTLPTTSTAKLTTTTATTLPTTTTTLPTTTTPLPTTTTTIPTTITTLPTTTTTLPITTTTLPTTSTTKLTTTTTIILPITTTSIPTTTKTLPTTATTLPTTTTTATTKLTNTTTTTLSPTTTTILSTTTTLPPTTTTKLTTALPTTTIAFPAITTIATLPITTTTIKLTATTTPLPTTTPLLTPATTLPQATALLSTTIPQLTTSITIVPTSTTTIPAITTAILPTTIPVKTTLLTTTAARQLSATIVPSTQIPATSATDVTTTTKEENSITTTKPSISTVIRTTEMPMVTTSEQPTTSAPISTAEIPTKAASQKTSIIYTTLQPPTFATFSIVSSTEQQTTPTIITKITQSNTFAVETITAETTPPPVSTTMTTEESTPTITASKSEETTLNLMVTTKQPTTPTLVSTGIVQTTLEQQTTKLFNVITTIGNSINNKKTTTQLANNRQNGSTTSKYTHVVIANKSTIAVGGKVTKSMHDFTSTIKDSIKATLPPMLQSLSVEPGEIAPGPSLAATLADASPFLLATLNDSLKESLGYSLFDMITTCTFNDVPCDMENDFKRIYSPLMGNCYTYNPGKIPKKWSRRAGANYGLKILLSADQYDYSCASTVAGFKIVIHENNITPFPEAEGYQIPLGTVNGFGMFSRQVIRNPMYTDCASDIFEKFNENYSIEACQRNCFQKYLLQSCRCLDPRYPLLPNGQYCTGRQSN